VEPSGNGGLFLNQTVSLNTSAGSAQAIVEGRSIKEKAEGVGSVSTKACPEFIEGLNMTGYGY
tara:strand:+ start:1052 stop:1240 length:189 start_codon:yes stop_codon:yes gene_type:complete